MLKVLEILSGPLKFMYANQLLGMILWMDIMRTVVSVLKAFYRLSEARKTFCTGPNIHI